MLKSVVLYVLLWHTSIPNLAAIASPSFSDTDMQSEPKENYDFHGSQPIFYVLSPLLARSGFGHNLNSINNVPRTDYLETTGIGAHKVHRRKVNWNHARKICVNEGGHLADIRSESEEKIVRQMMADLPVDEAWLGFHDKFEEGDWVSVLDEPLGAAGWEHWSKKFTPNPDNHNGEQHCARLMKDGGMDDENCDAALPFVCKISTA